MPEGPEIRVFSTALNVLSEQFFCVGLQKMPISKWTDISFSINDPEKPLPILNLEWSSRGKELGVALTNSNNIVKRYNFQMGLSGHFILCSEPDFNSSDSMKKHTVLRFLLNHNTNARSFFLCLYDTRRYAKWNENKNWNKDKGPCPYEEPEQFVNNIKKNLHKKDFSYPIYEALLNQKYFNGIGNYIRSILLYRLKFNFNLSAREYLEKYEDEFFYELFVLLNEAYDGQINDDLDDDFYYPYGKGKYIIDKNKRKFYYDN
jgi:endonuclease VIII-like 1